jgi:hypothetical protein
MRLQKHGYTVKTQTIPETITPKNRLLIGDPMAAIDDNASPLVGNMYPLGDERCPQRSR